MVPAAPASTNRRGDAAPAFLTPRGTHSALDYAMSSAPFADAIEATESINAPRLAAQRLESLPCPSYKILEVLAHVQC